jgi:hypothetical protein
MNKISFLLLIYLGDIFLGVPRFNNSKNIQEWMRMAETKSKNERRNCQIHEVRNDVGAAPSLCQVEIINYQSVQLNSR